MTAKTKRRAPRQPRYQGAGFLRDMSYITDQEQRRIDEEKRDARRAADVPAPDLERTPPPGR